MATQTLSESFQATAGEGFAEFPSSRSHESFLRQHEMSLSAENAQFSIIWEQKRIKEKRCDETRDAYMTSCDLWTHGCSQAHVNMRHTCKRIEMKWEDQTNTQITPKTQPEQPSASVHTNTTLNLSRCQRALNLMQPWTITCSSGVTDDLYDYL